MANQLADAGAPRRLQGEAAASRRSDCPRLVDYQDAACGPAPARARLPARQLRPLPSQVGRRQRRVRAASLDPARRDQGRQHASRPRGVRTGRPADPRPRRPRTLADPPPHEAQRPGPHAAHRLHRRGPRGPHHAARLDPRPRRGGPIQERGAINPVSSRRTRTARSDLDRGPRERGMFRPSPRGDLEQVIAAMDVVHRQRGDEGRQRHDRGGLLLLGIDLGAVVGAVGEVAEQRPGPLGEVAGPAVDGLRQVALEATDERRGPDAGGVGGGGLGMAQVLEDRAEGGVEPGGELPPGTPTGRRRTDPPSRPARPRPRRGRRPSRPGRGRPARPWSGRSSAAWPGPRATRGSRRASRGRGSSRRRRSRTSPRRGASGHTSRGGGGRIAG